MISPASDYRPIDARPARWSSTLNPISLQKRGLVHWLPLQRMDIDSHICADRRYRPAVTTSLAYPAWYPDQWRGSYGGLLVNAGGRHVANLPNSVTTLPLTITCWMRRRAGFTPGICVWVGSASGATWDGFYLNWGTQTSFAANHCENTVFADAVISGVTMSEEWIFCAGVFISNSDRWAYCNGIMSAHGTTALTTAATPKTTLALGGKPDTGEGSSFMDLVSLRDVRVYNYALGPGEIDEIYRNPYDLFQQFDRDDDYQFFTASAPVETLSPPALSVPVTLYTPEIFAPSFLEVPAQAIATTAQTPALLADLGLQISALTIAVTAQIPASVNVEEEVIVEDERTLEPHNYKVRIVEYVGGDDLRISRTYTELPEGVSINKGYLTVKRLATSDDAGAILQKTITSSEGITGQITDASTTGGSIDLYFDLTASETGSLTPLIPYHYDVQIVSLAGAIYTCEKGVIVMQQGVTDATS